MTQQLMDSPTIAPPSRRWVWPIRGLAIILGLTVLVFGTISVIGYFMLQTDTDTRFFSTPVDQIKVTAADGSVRIRTSSTHRGATVVSRSTSAFRVGEHTETISGRVLTVHSACRGGLFVADSCSVDLEITVAPGTRVTASTSIGDIWVQGTGAPVTARSSTGDLWISRANGFVDLKTNVGDITAEQMASTRVQSSTNTGTIRLNFIVPPEQVRAHSNIGDVRVGVPDGETTYRVDAEVSLGDRRIDVPTDPASPRTADLATNTGDIRMNLLSR